MTPKMVLKISKNVLQKYLAEVWADVPYDTFDEDFRFEAKEEVNWFVEFCSDFGWKFNFFFMKFSETQKLPVKVMYSAVEQLGPNMGQNRTKIKIEIFLLQLRPDNCPL